MFDFGQLLKGYRTRADLTREEPADALYAGVRTMFDREKGIRLPRKTSRDLLLKLEEVLAPSHAELDGLLRAAKLEMRYRSSRNIG
jgi:hypothetical protein